MTKIYNHSTILQYLYNELSEEDCANIKQAMLTDAAFYKKVNEVEQMLNSLNTAELEPSPTSIEIIMEYSAKKAEKSNKAEMV